MFVESQVSVIVLAAGTSRRMGRDKLLLEYDGKTFLQRAVDLVIALPVKERIIVTSAKLSASPCRNHGFKVLVNPSPEEGISKSVRIGIKAATGTHYLFLTADQPMLKVNDIMPLIDAVKSNPDKIIYPVIDSKPSSPTLFPAKYRLELLSLTGDSGGRSIRDKYKMDAFEIEPESPGNFIDIDTIEDYETVDLYDK